MNRIVSYSLYGDADLERTLGLMGDVEQRLRDAEMQEQHLGLIRDRVERELGSLLLTRGVAQGQSGLGEVEQRDGAERQDQRLGLIRDRVERELESLLLARGVEQAKSRLGELQQRKAEIERAL